MIIKKNGEFVNPPAPPPAVADTTTGMGYFAGIIAAVIAAFGVAQGPTGGVSADPAPMVAETVISAPKALVEVKALPYYLRIQHADGTIEQRMGGSIGWRYNNPGMLLYGPFTHVHGGYDSKQDHKVAVFETYAAGEAALAFYLFETDYKTLTVKEAFTRFAPKSDGFPTDKYIAYITKNAQISADEQVANLTDKDKANIIALIKAYENFTEGKTVSFANKAEWDANGWEPNSK